jgi:hypothetical protein
MMAKNTGEGYRKGEVKDRTQYYNPKTEQYVEHDDKTGKFINVKDDGTKFKGVKDKSKE